MAIKLEGGKALTAWPLVEEVFFAASLKKHIPGQVILDPTAHSLIKTFFIRESLGKS